MSLRSIIAGAGLIVFCRLLPGQAPIVTETKWVDNLEDRHKGRELLRKINGRWWTEDNREVTPPGPGGVFWTIDSKPGTCQFVHHRPFQLARAESLHLWMSQHDAEAILGKPNRALGSDDHAFWFYYASNGTKLTVRFMGEDGLGEAKYDVVGGKSRPVASVENDLGGQDIYTLMSKRAWARVQANDQKRMDEFRTNHAAHGQPAPNTVQPSGFSRGRPSVVTVDSSPIPAADPTPPKRIVPAEAIASIAIGASRDDVLARLGEPSSRYSISDDSGMRESFTYDLESGDTVVIRLLNGKVVKTR